MFMLLLSLAHARPIAEERSAFGKLSVTAPCTLVLDSPTHGKVEIGALACDAPGSLSAVDKMDTLLFPATAPGGTEFHLLTWSDPQFWGNAMPMDADMLYVVALDGNRAWVSDAFQGDHGTFSSARVEAGAAGRGGKLVLEMPGTRVSVELGKLTLKDLPVPAAPKRPPPGPPRTETISGRLNLAIHASNFRPYLESASDPQLAFDEGTCQLDELYDKVVTVTLTVAGDQDLLLSRGTCTKIVAK